MRRGTSAEHLAVACAVRAAAPLKNAQGVELLNPVCVGIHHVPGGQRRAALNAASLVGCMSTKGSGMELL